MTGDWHQRYGYRPVLLETFVETQRRRGTCYKAANWVHVGQTTGRGKKSRVHHQIIPVKDIWLYRRHYPSVTGVPNDPVTDQQSMLTIRSNVT